MEDLQQKRLMFYKNTLISWPNKFTCDILKKRMILMIQWWMLYKWNIDAAVDSCSKEELLWKIAQIPRKISTVEFFL